MPATYVALNATVQMAGFSTKNWDVERDRCELHLHEKTGGVFVTRGEEYLFISPALISHVELRMEQEEASTQSLPPGMQVAYSPLEDKHFLALKSSKYKETEIDAVLREIAGNVAREDAESAGATGSKRRAPRRAKK